MLDNIIRVKNIEIGNHLPFVLIAGPCQIESLDHSYKMADKLSKVCRKLNIALVFKGSFDKANRTSVNTPRGVGIDEGLKVALLNECDLFLMPSVIYKKSVEGFGISFIEAGSYGKASIGGRDGGQADAIEEGRTGFLCNGNELNSIYESILKSLQNEKYKVLGLQAKEFSKKFQWEIIVKQYLNLI